MSAKPDVGVPIGKTIDAARKALAEDLLRSMNRQTQAVRERQANQSIWSQIKNEVA